MIELVKLEEQHKEFDSRNTRIIAVSLDGLEDSSKTQAKFPHLVIASDSNQKLAKAADVLGPHHAPDGKETTAPTTVLIDNKGIVRWVFRPDVYITRLSAADLTAKVDEYLRK